MSVIVKTHRGTVLAGPNNPDRTALTKEQADARAARANAEAEKLGLDVRYEVEES